MLSLSPATRVFVAIQPVDMRRCFNGLYADVQTVFGQDPLTGHLFLFTNRRRGAKEVTVPEFPMGACRRSLAVFGGAESACARTPGFAPGGEPRGPAKRASRPRLRPRVRLQTGCSQTSGARIAQRTEDRSDAPDTDPHPTTRGVQYE